jgi:hypothetical protein
MLATYAVESVLFVVNGENAEDNGDVAIRVEISDALGYALAYVIEVRCSATDNATEDDNGVIKACFDKLRSGKG